MDRRFYIMKMWQTGNVGSHNIKKMDLNPKDGYLSRDMAEKALMDFYDAEEFEICYNVFTNFTILEVFSTPKKKR